MCKSFARWDVNNIIIHSKYFPVSDWLKPHAEFTITRCCLPNLERIFAILNQWRQKCSPLQIIEPLMEKTWGQGCVIFGERKKRAKWQNSFKNEEIFWMNNKPIIKFGFRRIWRILQALGASNQCQTVN